MVRCTPPGATWPQYWTRGHADRAGLLAALEPFLTDDCRRFGAIVAPLVNGLTVTTGLPPPTWSAAFWLRCRLRRRAKGSPRR